MVMPEARLSKSETKGGTQHSMFSLMITASFYSSGSKTLEDTRVMKGPLKHITKPEREKLVGSSLLPPNATGPYGSVPPLSPLLEVLILQVLVQPSLILQIISCISWPHPLLYILTSVTLLDLWAPLSFLLLIDLYPISFTPIHFSYCSWLWQILGLHFPWTKFVKSFSSCTHKVLATQELELQTWVLTTFPWISALLFPPGTSLSSNHTELGL